MLPMLEEEAKRSMLAGESDPTEIVQEDMKGESANRAGDVVGVSGVLVYKAKRLKRENSELAAKVEAGEASVKTALEASSTWGERSAASRRRRIRIRR